jgi:hypothetical protein
MNFPKSGSDGERDVGDILAAMNDLKLGVSQLTVSNVVNTSKLLHKKIQGSSLCEIDTRQEAIALRQAAQNLELAMSEIHTSMARIENSLKNNAMISSSLSIADLSTPDDISQALQNAVNGPGRDWIFAAKIVERFTSCYWALIESEDDDDSDGDDDELEPEEFLQAVWASYNFQRNLARLFCSGNVSIVNKLLESFDHINPFSSEVPLSAKIFDSLASILITVDDRKWIYLIAKNQEKEIDHGISRLINSYLCTQKDKDVVICNALKLMWSYTDEHFVKSRCLYESNSGNMININILAAPNMFKALVKIISEERMNDTIMEYCLHFLSSLLSYNSIEQPGTTEASLQIVRVDLVRFGICELLIPLLGGSRYVIKALTITHFISKCPEYIPRFITMGLLPILVQIFHTPKYSNHNSYDKIIKDLCNYDSNIGERFHELGVPKKSKKRCFMTYLKGVAKKP